MGVAQVVIENPILNSPYDEPTRHFRFDDDGITGEVVEGRRPSSYFMPIPRPARSGGQQQFDTEWTPRPQRRDRSSSTASGSASHCGAQAVGRASRPSPALCSNTGAPPTASARCSSARSRRSKRSIFSPRWRSALGDAWIENELRAMADDADPGLFRLAARWRRHGQDGRDGDAHRLADAQQAAQPAGQAVRRRLPGRGARHHHPRPAAGAAAVRPRQLLPRARPRPARPGRRPGPGQDRHHQLPRLQAPREGRAPAS